MVYICYTLAYIYNEKYAYCELIYFPGVQGLLVLLWVYLVDLMRRFIATHELGEVLLFTMTPLLILAAGVSFFLCFLMERCGESILPTKSSYSAMLELD